MSVTDTEDAGPGLVRLAALMASVLAAGCLIVVLAGAFLLIVTDNPLACFDGGEPACDDPLVGASLSDVGLVRWLVAAAGLLAATSAFVAAWHLRRTRQVIGVAMLCAAALAASAYIYSRF